MFKSYCKKRGSESYYYSQPTNSLKRKNTLNIIIFGFLLFIRKLSFDNQIIILEDYCGESF